MQYAENYLYSLVIVSSKCKLDTYTYSNDLCMYYIPKHFKYKISCRS